MEGHCTQHGHYLRPIGCSRQAPAMLTCYDVLFSATAVLPLPPKTSSTRVTPPRPTVAKQQLRRQRQVRAPDIVKELNEERERKRQLECHIEEVLQEKKRLIEDSMVRSR